MLNGYLIAQAGVPAAEWMRVHITPEADTMQPLVAARNTAWRVGAAVGLAAALPAGLLAWVITRPITRLQARAASRLDDDAGVSGDWPRDGGEIGALKRAFQHVVEPRHRRGRETHRLLEAARGCPRCTAHAGIALTRERRFELVSRHFCELFGLDRSELLGHDTRRIFTTDEQHRQLSVASRDALRSSGLRSGKPARTARRQHVLGAHPRQPRPRPRTAGRNHLDRRGRDAGA